VEPTLVYDGDCGICQASIDLLARFGCRAVPVTSVEWLLDHPADAERCETSVLLVDADGRVTTAEHAVAGALRLCRRPGPWLATLIELPGLHLFARLAYRFVADRRTRISQALGLTACSLPDRPSRP
jgi:predicted DCC family thiol-disulfide oxidoreductase YuxK